MSCGLKTDKVQLFRVVQPRDGAPHGDLRGREPGRGAYVCRNPECLKKAVKSRALGRALGAEIPEDIYDTLRAQLEADHE